MAQCSKCGGSYGRGINTSFGTRYRCQKCGHSITKPTKPVRRSRRKINNNGKKIGVLGGHSIFAISHPKGLY